MMFPRLFNHRHHSHIHRGISPRNQILTRRINYAIDVILTWHERCGRRRCTICFGATALHRRVPVTDGIQTEQQMLSCLVYVNIRASMTSVTERSVDIRRHRAFARNSGR